MLKFLNNEMFVMSFFWLEFNTYQYRHRIPSFSEYNDRSCIWNIKKSIDEYDQNFALEEHWFCLLHHSSTLHENKF